MSLANRFVFVALEDVIVLLEPYSKSDLIEILIDLVSVNQPTRSQKLAIAEIKHILSN